MAGDLLRRLGLFVEQDFLDRATCATLRAACRAGSIAPATVYEGNETHKLEVAVRRTTRARVSPEVLDAVTSRLMGVKPDVERHFHLPLTACQEPQFLIYGPGDFFSRHTDGGDDPGAPVNARSRKVSVVIFLSDEARDGGEGSHSGGALVLYDLVPDGRLKGRGFLVASESGLLVAFRATAPHAVTPVVSGERYSIVSWFE